MDSSLIAGSSMLWQKINDCVTRCWRGKGSQGASEIAISRFVLARRDVERRARSRRGRKRRRRVRERGRAKDATRRDETPGFAFETCNFQRFRPFFSTLRISRTPIGSSLSTLSSVPVLLYCRVRATHPAFTTG